MVVVGVEGLVQKEEAEGEDKRVSMVSAGKELQ